MKAKQYSEITSHRLMYKYRVFRRGIMSLSHLESNLVLELEKLSEVHVPIAKVPLEREYLVNSLKTIRHEIRTTYQSLAILKRAVERSKVSERDLEKVITKQLKDSPHEQDIWIRIRSLGGPLKFLDRFLLFLRPRYDEYSKCIDLVNQYSEVSNEAITLADLAIRVEDCIPSNPDIMYRICWNPLSCLVAAVVIVATIIFTEGEAGGEEEEEEEESELGDFPEPDPDGDRPV